jgi:uncharacterized protein with HEPN domain
MLKDDRIRLQHMLEAVTEALDFTQGRTRSDLDRDRMLVLSLIKELEIIGEAATKVSIETRNGEKGSFPELSLNTQWG